MAHVPVHAPVSLPRNVLTSAEKFSRQRRAAAEAHARAQAFQVKVAVVFTCVVGCPLAFGIYQGATANKASVARQQAAIEMQADNELRVGAIQLPYRGDLCRKLHFDNRTGAISGESTVRCAAIEVVSETASNPRASAIMSAFKFK
jgi:hypothetical protein